MIALNLVPLTLHRAFDVWSANPVSTVRLIFRGVS